MFSWDSPSSVTTLFEPNWQTIVLGTSLHVVVDLICWSETAALCRTKPSGVHCRICHLPAAAGNASSITVFNASLANRLDGIPILVYDSRSTLIVHQPLQACHFLNLVEFCAGMGASSIGLSEAGFSLKAAVEWNEPMAALHRRIHEGAPVSQGDIGDVQTLIKTKECCPEPFCLMAGVSCQPYSRGGSQAGGFDNRALTVPAVCKACHFLQVPLLIIECVTPAQTNAFVRSHLDHLCTQLGMQLSEGVLQLEHTWASNRARWWVVAVSSQFGEIPLPPLPGLGKFLVQDLIPYVKDWPSTEQEQLLLNEEEQRTFQKYGPARKFAVKMDNKLPTALHSWGGQATACACGCRPSGFSSQLLDDKGLYAQLFPVMHSTCDTQQWRHLHVKEVCLLNGLPPQQNWSDNQRLNLAAAGQMASPLQSAWVGALSIKQIFGILGVGWKGPLECVNNLKQLVLQQTQQLFPAMPQSVKMDFP